MGKYIFALFLVFLPLQASADDNGKCGENVSYTYNATTRTLTIEGSGAMDDYQFNYDTRPWKSFLNNINSVIVQEGVTTIGDWAFCLFQPEEPIFRNSIKIYWQRGLL